MHNPGVWAILIVAIGMFAPVVISLAALGIMIYGAYVMVLVAYHAFFWLFGGNQ